MTKNDKKRVEFVPAKRVIDFFIPSPQSLPSELSGIKLNKVSSEALTIEELIENSKKVDKNYLQQLMQELNGNFVQAKKRGRKKGKTKIRADVLVTLVNSLKSLDNKKSYRDILKELAWKCNVSFSALKKLYERQKPRHDVFILEEDKKKLGWISKDAIDYYNDGDNFLSEGNLDEALQSLNKAIKLKPKFFLAYYDQGICHFKKQLYKEAITDFEKVIDSGFTFIYEKTISPSFNFDAIRETVFEYLARAYIAIDDKEKAIQTFNKALQYNPFTAVVYCNNIGCLYFEQGNFEKAENYFRRAVNLALTSGADRREYVLGYYNLGLVYRKQANECEATNVVLQ